MPHNKDAYKNARQLIKDRLRWSTLILELAILRQDLDKDNTSDHSPFFIRLEEVQSLLKAKSKWGESPQETDLNKRNKDLQKEH